MAPALERERPREAEDPGLGRRVGRLPEAAERARDGGHVHDPSPAALLHVRPNGLRAVEAACQVDAQVALPEVGALLVELGDVVERARVVDEDVHRAELAHGALDRRVDLCAVGHVALERERAPAQLADLVDGRLRVDHSLRARRLGECPVALRVLPGVRLELDVGDHDVGARASRSSPAARAGPAAPTR